MKIKLYLLYVLVAALGLCIGNITLSYFTKKAKPAIIPTAIKPAQVKPPTPSAPVGVAEAIARYSPSPTPKKKVFVLNGIYFAKDGGYALIDNQIVKVGSELDGAIVKRIDQDEVELENEGAVVKLSTRIR